MRYMIFAVLGASAAMGAAAEVSTSKGIGAVLACRALSDDAARLACFDRETGALAAAEAAGEVQVIARADVEAIERESFGFQLPSLPQLIRRDRGEETLDEVTAAITSVTMDNLTGRLRVALDNGQVWEQSDSANLQMGRVRRAKTATIKRAALGSFKLTFEDAGTIRVKRVE